MFAGLVILIIGVLFLLENLGVITSGVWSIFWPLLLIAIGLWLIFKRKHWMHWQKYGEGMHKRFHEKGEE